MEEVDLTALDKEELIRLIQEQSNQLSVKDAQLQALGTKSRPAKDHHGGQSGHHGHHGHRDNSKQVGAFRAHWCELVVSAIALIGRNEKCIPLPENNLPIFLIFLM